MSAQICALCAEGRHNHPDGQRCMHLAEIAYGVAV